MYLFYMMPNGYIPVGTDGQLSLPRSTPNSKLRKLAINWLGKRAGRVYLMASWTQPMSELGPWPFSDYIRAHGELIAHS